MLTNTVTKTTIKLTCACALLIGLSACNTLNRLSDVGGEPKLSQIENPAAITGYKPIIQPMPRPVPDSEQAANSLWRAGSRAFFKDQRASDVGDILTVDISIDDTATLNNSTSRERDNAENAGLSSFLGLETQLAQVLPDAVNPANLVAGASTSKASGTGKISRNEKINLKVAATVIQILPNGNLVVAGRQETRVNYEVRELQVAGIVRPEDITSTNTIDFDQVAEARIAYGGRGHISDVQQPRYGQQIYDIVWPF